MSTQTPQAAAPAPAWYFDARTGSHRYWDGQDWLTPMDDRSHGQADESRAIGGPERASRESEATYQPALAPDLSGSPLGPREAVSSAFRNTFSVKGRASVSAYWWFVAFQMLFVAALYGGLYFLSLFTEYGLPPIFGLLALFAYVPVLVAGISLLGRRLHDINASAHFLWFHLVPFFGSLILLVMSLLPPKEPNRFAPAWN